MKHWKWSEENAKKFIRSVQIAESYSDVIRLMGFANGNGARRRIDAGIRKFGLSTTHFTGQLWSKGKTIYSDPRVSKKKIEDVFCANSLTARSQIRSTILKEKLIEYKCQKCGTGPTWNDETLTLQLDHINGVGNDHRLSNLRFLCPNCHSQTETFCKNSQTRYSDEEIIQASAGCKTIHEVMIKLGATTGVNYRRFKKLLPDFVRTIKSL